MNAAYHIEVPVKDLGDTDLCNLYLEIAPDHLLFAVLNNETREFVVLQYINLDKYNTLNHCKEIVYHNEWLAKLYNKVVITYNFPDSILVPEQVYEEGLNKTSLELVYGDLNKGDTFNDRLEQWGVYNVYRVPVVLHQLMNGHFPKGCFFHYTSVFLKCKKQQEVLTAGDEVELVFYPNKMFFSLFRDGRLQLVQTFEYETAEDISYHLLNTCRRFAVDCEKVSLKVSGLLDDHSSVYSELQKYFLNIQLHVRPAEFQYNAVFDEYPAHFFTSLFSTALCE